MKTTVLALAALSVSVSLQPTWAQTAVSAAEIYASVCANCHGRTGRGMASFPRLSGQSENYLADRLTTYRAGEQVGPNSALMIPNAMDLSDEDITNLAAFMASTFE